ncbi:hypothetical protein ACFLVE_03445 [Chloroflexota bacterium]
MTINRLMGIIAAVILLVLLASPVTAQAPNVHQFSGSVALDGAVCPGSTVEAKTDGAVVGTATVTTDSMYYMLIPQIGDVPKESAMLILYVDGNLGGTHTWEAGGITALDLSAFTVPTSTYNLEVTIRPSEGGTVEKAPDLADYGEDMEVTLTARAASGYEFSHWGGDASGGSSSKTVIMDGDKSVTANFVEEEAPPEDQEPSSETETPSSTTPTEPSPTPTSPSPTPATPSPTPPAPSPTPATPSPTPPAPSPTPAEDSLTPTAHSKTPVAIAPALFFSVLAAGLIIVIVLVILIIRTRRPI